MKNVLFTILVPGTVAVFVPIRLAGGEAGLRSWPWGPAQAVAAAPLLAGAAIYLRCVWDFARIGRGTPAPIDEPRRVVAAGLYRYVRNPMYLGVLLLILGWAAFFMSWPVLAYGGVCAAGFHAFVVLYEEPHLRRRFGESYERYRGAVRRWIPGRPYEPTA